MRSRACRCAPVYMHRKGHAQNKEMCRAWGCQRWLESRDACRAGFAPGGPHHVPRLSACLSSG
eukprot:1158163-Pelagomonas_calceolata.AAC.9